MSLNIPGFPKSSSSSAKFFGICLTELKYYFQARLIQINHSRAIEICDEAGDYYLAPLHPSSISILEIKEIAESFEEQHPLGRFIDVDIHDKDGLPISSGKSKACFLCQTRAAIACRREQTHTENELRSFMFARMEDYCHSQRQSHIVKQLAAFALNAILHEIALTPKPGLVDRFSNGSHSDMNFMTFVDSSAAIAVWFMELAEAGFAFEEEDFTKALPLVRNIGLRMEAAMFKATAGINTQKGIIFLLGLALFASGKLFAMQEKFDELRFRTIVRKICNNLVNNELNTTSFSSVTHGEAVFRKNGYAGARGEAESGFKTVFEAGLPQLIHGREDFETCKLKCFLAIAAQNWDTNILYRSDQAVLTHFRELCQKALDHYSNDSLNEVSKFCREKNISPGGSADLLALSLFVRSVITADFGL